MSADGGRPRIGFGFLVNKPGRPGSVEPKAPRHGTGVDYDTAWARNYPVRLARAVLVDNLARPLARAVCSPRVDGLERLDTLDGPAIFTANHASHVDTGLLLSVLPARIRHRAVVAAAADYFFDTRWKGALWAFGLNMIPIERVRVNRRSADVAAELIEEGWNLVIFPEGGRSPDGWGQEFKGGAAYLARRCGVPVVPVHLAGTRDILAKDSKRIRPGQTEIRFGRPLHASVDEGGRQEDARHLAQRVEQAVAALADEAASDWWSARRRAASGSTPSLRGPEVSPWRRSWALPAPDAQRVTTVSDRARWARKATSRSASLGVVPQEHTKP